MRKLEMPSLLIGKALEELKFANKCIDAQNPFAMEMHIDEAIKFLEEYFKSESSMNNTSRSDDMNLQQWQSESGLKITSGRPQEDENESLIILAKRRREFSAKLIALAEEAYDLDFPRIGNWALREGRRLLEEITLAIDTQAAVLPQYPSKGDCDILFVHLSDEAQKKAIINFRECRGFSVLNCSDSDAIDSIKSGWWTFDKRGLYGKQNR